MARPGVLLPIQQSWSCHNCGGCCREHQIAITSAEKERLDKQRWTAADGTPTDRALIVPLESGWRLNHNEDGACVFLDAQGLCRIHAKFGEAAKPLACRVYPYAVHPAGSMVTVSLRFSCPSVTQNAGIPITQQRKDLESLVSEIVPSDYAIPPGLTFSDSRQFNWPDLTRLLAFLERGLTEVGVRPAIRLVRILTWLDLLEKSPDEVLRGERLSEILPLLFEAAARAVPAECPTPPKPSGLGRLMFRQLVAVLLRHDTLQQTRWSERLRLLREGLTFTLGVGRVPLIPDPNSVRVAFSERTGQSPGNLSPSFAQLEQPFETADRNAVDDLLTRYLRVKTSGLHFCGPAFYGYSIVDGFRSLALMLPVIMWTARIRAARSGRQMIELPDVQAALTTVDHNFGYSPALGLSAARRRVQQLWQMQQITAMCLWYGL